MAVQVEKRHITPRTNTVREKPKTREELMIDALSPNLMIMVKAVRKAGRRMIRDFGEISSLQVSRKGPGDFVTNADILAEKTLIEALSADRPDYGFITEEQGVIPPKNNSPYTWVIDPIDGTNNFIHAIPVFAISVALLENMEVVAGVTFNPITNELYYAEKGRGSYVMTPTGNQRLRVSGRVKIDGSLIGSSSYGTILKSPRLQKALKDIPTIRYNGSTTLSLAAVASGQYDAHLATQFKIWDVATGYLLVREAGGYIANFDEDIRLSELTMDKGMLACNIGLKDTFIKLTHK